MRITIIYDNTAYREDLQADWGFSCLVEIEGVPNILFDTGGDGSILLSNMKKLHIDPGSIEIVFISHAHYDHTGGLSAFLEVNNDVTVYCPDSFRGVRRAKKVVSVKESLKIYENVFSTGELDGIEQSMAVSTERGIVVITGCSHPAMSHILDAASQFGKLYGIIGGFHGFSEFELFKSLGLICPTHCTQHKKEIKFIYPEQTIEGGAGRIIEI